MLRFYDSDGLFNGIVDNVSSDDNFYYVYGVLHSPEYRQKYVTIYKKIYHGFHYCMIKKKYVAIGRQLAELHLNYEKQPIWEGIQVEITGESPNYYVKKMKHPKKGYVGHNYFQ